MIRAIALPICPLKLQKCAFRRFGPVGLDPLLSPISRGSIFGTVEAIQSQLMFGCGFAHKIGKSSPYLCQPLILHKNSGCAL